jgi:aldose 1-epimerase
LYTLTNAHGMKAKIITYGGIITELDAPDRDGKMGDVVLGFDNLQSYLAGSPYFGALIGRVANRVAKGRFTLDGREYKLFVNNGPNALHGGEKGFDKVV